MILAGACASSYVAMYARACVSSYVKYLCATFEKLYVAIFVAL